MGLIIFKKIIFLLDPYFKLILNTANTLPNISNIVLRLNFIYLRTVIFT